MGSELIEGTDDNGNTVFFPLELLFDDAMATEKSKKDKKKDKKDEGPVKYNEWIYTNGQYIPAKDTTVSENVKPGFYSVMYSNNTYSILNEELNTDELYELPNSIIKDVIDEIEMFWTKADLFKESKIVHKRGIMLYGGPGCGKTSIINILSKNAIKRGGIVFHIKSVNDLHLYIDFMDIYFRQVEPDTPVITVIEDIDNLLRQDESSLLNFLDGDDQFEHNVVIGTTNRIDELNDLLLRPSRFDWLIEVPLPDASIRKFFIEKKGITDEVELDKWVKATDKMSMAQLKELFIAVKLLENDFDTVIKKLKDHDNQIINTTFKPKSKPIGFSSNR